MRTSELFDGGDQEISWKFEIIKGHSRRFINKLICLRIRNPLRAQQAKAVSVVISAATVLLAMPVPTQKGLNCVRIVIALKTACDVTAVLI